MIERLHFSYERRSTVWQLAATLLAATAHASPPENAILLFDGKGINRFVSMTGRDIDWPIDRGALVSTANGRRSNNLVSRLHFRDAEIHVEFLLPPGGDGNSGVYVHGVYELQILDSSDRKGPTIGDMGAVYGLHAPLVSAGRGRGTWQTLDIHYRAPRRDEAGRLTAEGTITAWLNGQKIHDHVKVGEKTSDYNPYEYDTTPYLKAVRKRQRQTGCGPLLLQDHDNAVRFRNIWVRPLDGQTCTFDPLERGAPIDHRTPAE